MQKRLVLTWVLRSWLRKLIEEHTGWVCVEALNGRDAIMKIQQLAPDILILDLFMPVNGRTPGGLRTE
jgi:YesN/AraC family two-component response regulator